MNLALPKPYPDELIYSVIARHFAYLQPASVAMAHRSIDGVRWFSTRYVRNAEGLAEKTRLTWGLSGLEILDRHTLLPFNGAFLRPEVHLKCTECFLKTNPHGGATALGMGNSSVLEPKFLRFCISCLRNDLENSGESYWRRQHQLSGTLFCTKHNEQLRNSTARTSPLDMNTLDATCHCQPLAPPSIFLTEREALLGLLIAQRSARILTGAITPWLKPNLTAEYQKAALEVGYGIGFKKLNTVKIGSDLIEHFGKSLLEKLGCSLTKRSAAFRNVFHEEGTNHPLLHVLVQLFLEDRQASSRSTLKTNAIDPSFRREWKCPNTFANHDDDFRVADIQLRLTKTGKHYLHGRCSCGYIFAFGRAREGDPDMPLVSKVSGYGAAIEAEIKRSYLAHGVVDKVCKELNLHWRVVRRTLDGARTQFEVSPEKIAMLREAWLSEPGTRNGNAGYQHYQKLLKFDREWLLAQPRRRRTVVTDGGRPDRGAEDRALAKQIEAATRALRESGNRVTVLGLSRRLEKRVNVKGLRLMPKTVATLRRVLDVPSKYLERARDKAPFTVEPSMSS
jgi:hypothetical protein